MLVLTPNNKEPLHEDPARERLLETGPYQATSKSYIHAMNRFVFKFIGAKRYSDITPPHMQTTELQELITKFVK